MVNVPTQVSYWRKGAQEDWQVACELIAAGRIRHGFFFAHLALEKLLKAGASCLRYGEDAHGTPRAGLAPVGRRIGG